jgi:hypothetical protein
MTIAAYPPSEAPAGATPSFVPRTTLHAEDEILDRLAIYVGPGWESHYRRAFERLMRAERTGSMTWTWNWAAALFSAWFLYRRLYGAFIAFGIAYRFLGVLVVPVLFIVQGCMGDRLLFNKAMAEVRRPGLRGSPAALAERGKPLRWVLWLCVALNVLLGLFFAASLGFGAAETVR